jgi:anaerobic selenocysteine-containing dehydrogenase
MTDDEVVRSTCAICFTGCGVLVHIRDGKVVKVEGNPDAPLSKGVLCPKGRASVEYLYHPDRLRHPLKRVGKRGAGGWEQISWGEALATIAEKMNGAKAEHGPESVIFLRGASYGLQDLVLVRLANAFGSPNNASAGYVCHVPKVNAANITFGQPLVPDYEYPPSCVLAWGTNPDATSLPTFVQISHAVRSGARLIVVDPRETELARMAALWVRPKPASDLSLALGLLNVIIGEDLYDKRFVRDWTTGFDALVEHVRDYPPEQVEEMTWVPARTVRDMARLYSANGPAVTLPGNAIEQTADSFQVQRAVYMLEAITGNVGVPGGEVAWTNPAQINRGSPALTLQDMVPPEQRARRFGAERLAPFAQYALPQSMVQALLERAAYRPRVCYIQGGNLLNGWTGALETRRAFEELDFMVVADMFLTPTAAVADMVLPSAMYLEFDCISHCTGAPNLIQVQQKVAQAGECWSDTRILIELARRLGLGDFFWKDEYGFADELLKPAGLTFEEFRKVGVISGTRRYRHFLTDGFKTPSGKVELYSKRLGDWGFDSLPVYRARDAELEPSDVYPLLLTNWKPAEFRHSSLRQMSSLRAKRPDPMVEMNPETAQRMNIRDGEDVWIETRYGKIEQKAHLVGSLDPRVVVIEHGWWYPEQGIETLYGWDRSNANVLTGNGPPFGREMGTPTMRGIPCKVYGA